MDFSAALTSRITPLATQELPPELCITQKFSLTCTATKNMPHYVFA
jgi:hypothetical protein